MLGELEARLARPERRAIEPDALRALAFDHALDPQEDLGA